MAFGFGKSDITLDVSRHFGGIVSAVFGHWDPVGYGVGYVQYVQGGLALFLGPLFFLGFLAMVYDRPRIDGFIMTHLLLIPSFAMNAANLFDI